MKLLHLQVACTENRVIGRQREIPWHIPEDKKFYHDQTAGQIVVLGRICYEVWPRAAKDGRVPIVISRDTSLAEPGVHVVPSLDAALTLAETLAGEIHVCGGQRIYEETLALSRPMRLHLTLIHAVIEGDVFFPEWRHLAWRELNRRESSDANYRYTFYTLER